MKTYILLGKDIDFINLYINNKLGRSGSYVISNNYDELFVDTLKRYFPDNVILFFTSGISPGEKGYWEADIIVDKKEDRIRWENM